MNLAKEKQNIAESATRDASAWRKAFRSVFGAATRLHQYRDAQDLLLRRAILDDERRIREQHCCYE